MYRSLTYVLRHMLFFILMFFYLFQFFYSTNELMFYFSDLKQFWM